MKIDEYGLDRIVEELEGGEYLRHIANRIGVSLSSLQEWVAADSGRSQACARAREEGAEHWDCKSAEVIADAQDQFELAKAKELAIHYRWRSKAIAPRKYGDNQNVNVSGALDVRAVFAGLNAAHEAAQSRTDSDSALA